MDLNIFKMRDRYEFIIKNYLLSDDMPYQMKFETGDYHCEIEEDISTEYIFVRRSSFFMKINENHHNNISWAEFIDDAINEASINVNYVNEIKKIRATETPFGILLFEMSDNNVYAVCFGYASLSFNQYADPDFGLNFAERVLTDQTIDVESKQHINANKKKSLTVFALDALSSVEYGSADDFIKGRILTDHVLNAGMKKDITRILKYIESDVSFGVSIKFRIRKKERKSIIQNYDQIIELLIQLIIFMKKYNDPQYITLRIPRLTYINPKDPTYERLNELLLNAINNNSIDIGIDFYSVIGSEIKINEETNVRLNSVGMKGENFENLTIENVKQYINSHASFEPIDVLSRLKVKFDDKTRTLLSLLSADVYDKDTDQDYILVNGKWAMYNRIFSDYIDLEMDILFSKEIVEVLDTPFSCDINDLVDFLENNYSLLDKKYREYVYNTRIAKLKKMVCLDTDNQILKKYPNVEVADLYRKDELIHVKIGDVGKFIENIEQSALAATVMTENESKNDLLEAGHFPEALNDVFTSSLLLVFENRNINEFDIRTIRSMKFKSYLIEWYKIIEKFKLNGKIYIANINKDGNSFSELAKKRGLNV